MMNGPAGNTDEELNEDRLRPELPNQARAEGDPAGDPLKAQTAPTAPSSDSEMRARAAAANAGRPPVFETWLTRYRQRLDAVDEEKH